MKNFRYLKEVTTLRLDSDKCIGCGACINVCPHHVFELAEKKAIISNKESCMECGACALNCPPEALSVKPGVGCAAYIIQAWIYGPEKASCGSGNCC